MKSFRTDILPYIIIITKKWRLKFFISALLKQHKKGTPVQCQKYSFSSVELPFFCIHYLCYTLFKVDGLHLTDKCEVWKLWAIHTQEDLKGQQFLLVESNDVYNTYLKWQSNQRTLMRKIWELVIFIIRAYYKYHFCSKNKDKWACRPSRKFLF